MDMQNSGKDTGNISELQASRPPWWKIPFDPTTSFSLLGFILGGLRWDYHRNRTDLHLDDD